LNKVGETTKITKRRRNTKRKRFLL
jgi:hypothetical protein